jgi:hypothetical protein
VPAARVGILRGAAGLRGVFGLAPAAPVAVAGLDVAGAVPGARRVAAGLVAAAGFGVAVVVEVGLRGVAFAGTPAFEVTGFVAAALVPAVGDVAVLPPARFAAAAFGAVTLVAAGFATAVFEAAVRLVAGAAAFAVVLVRGAGRRRDAGGFAGAAGAVTTGVAVLTGETEATAWIVAVPTARAASPVALVADPAADAARLASLPARAATSWAASPACFERLATCFLPLVACAAAS